MIRFDDNVKKVSKSLKVSRELVKKVLNKTFKQIEINLNEDKSFTDATHSTTQAGTTRTTSDGSTAWTESDVNGLRMSIKCTSITNAGSEISLDFLKIDVDYNAPVTGAPIKLDSGLVKLTSGLIRIS